MLDVYVLPISIESGKETPDLPGLYVTASPHNANRHRSEEVLILFMNTNENPAVPLNRLQGIFDNLSSTYFKTPGAVTAAIRALIKQLNDALLKSNLSKAREGKQTIGILNLAVVHKDQIYIVHSGDTHSLLLSPNQAEDFYHPQPPANGLGLRDNPDIHYYQAQIEPGYTLVLSNSIPEGFINNLPTGGGRISLEQLRRRLMNLTEAKSRFAIMQFQNGKGEVRFLKPRSTSVDADIPEPLPSPLPTPIPNTVSQPDIEESIPGPQIQHKRPGRHEPAELRRPPNMARPVMSGEKKGWLRKITSLFKSPAAAQPSDPTAPAPSVGPLGQPFSTSAGEPPVVTTFFPTRPGESQPPFPQPLQAAATNPRPDSLSDTKQIRVEAAPPVKAQSQPAPLDKVSWRKWMGTALKGGQKTGEKIKEGGSNMLLRVLPGDQEQLPQMSPSLMLVIAVAVPLIIAAVAVTIYYQLGPQKEFHDDMSQAEKTAAQISKITDINLQINAMQQTIQYVDQAEKHLVNDQSRSLRMQIQDGLDKIYDIKRVEYQPISDNLDGTVKITRILSNPTDTYLLDSSQGVVKRLIQSGQRYRVDATFECGPGQVGVVRVDNLVDFVLLPANTPNKAAVLGIDRNGTLLYCIPGEKPLAKSLTPPDLGWGNIASMVIDDDGLIYVMDTKTNSIFIYLQQNYTYPDPPRLYFNDQIPANMAGMIDLSINRNELYLLNTDGHMVHCIFRAYADSQTRCTDPSPYHDDRPGKATDSPFMDGTNFKRIFVVGVPDPSIFVLDAASSSLYQLSLRLTFYRQLQMQLYPDHKPLQAASAFTISPARIIWIAYGNEVYYGQLP